MQRFILIFIALGLIVSAVAFAGAGENLPPADAGKLWTHMTETNPYQGWGYWPGYAGIYPGKSPHGKYLKLFANPIALKAAREGKPMPDGSILVKENYGGDKKTLKAVTPMYKVKGYNPEGGDWFWVKYGPNGKIQAAGQPKGCVDCHKAVKDKDWVFTQPK